MMAFDAIAQSSPSRGSESSIRAKIGDMNFLLGHGEAAAQFQKPLVIDMLLVCFWIIDEMGL